MWLHREQQLNLIGEVSGCSLLKVFHLTTQDYVKLNDLSKVDEWVKMIIRKYFHAQYVIPKPYGPRQANLLLIAYASSEGSGEPAHPRSLARTFAARSYKQ